MSGSPYLRLADKVSLKRLEKPCLYHAGTDELYELTEDAFALLLLCDGTRAADEVGLPEELLSTCREEGLLEELPEPRPRPLSVGVNPTPSLRYLVLEVTSRCNLRCRHCYQGEAGTRDLELRTVLRVLDEFGEMGGLRLAVSGGEPLLYPFFSDLNRAFAERPYRRVLITNGLFLKRFDPAELNFEEVQFSLDGLEEGHDFLRGEGTFRRTLEQLRRALGAGLQVSVATVIHRRNLGELPRLGELLREMGAWAWTLEYPVVEGRLQEEPGLLPALEEAAPLLGLGWGESLHEGVPGYACGPHLATVLPSGTLVKCDYYPQLSGGEVREGLRRAWGALPRMTQEGICEGCEVLPECGGGCRYRAEKMGGRGAPDPVACLRMGRTPPPEGSPAF